MKKLGLYVNRALTTTALAGILYSSVKMQNVAKREAALSIELKKNGERKFGTTNSAAEIALTNRLAVLSAEISTKREELFVEEDKLAEIKQQAEDSEAAILEKTENARTDLEAFSQEKRKVIDELATAAANATDAEKKVAKADQKMVEVTAKLAEANATLAETNATLAEAKAELEKATDMQREVKTETAAQKVINVQKRADIQRRATKAMADATETAAGIVEQARNIQRQAQAKLEEAQARSAQTLNLTTDHELEKSELRIAFEALEVKVKALKQEKKEIARKHRAEIASSKQEHEKEIIQACEEATAGERATQQRRQHSVEAQFIAAQDQVAGLAAEIEELKALNGQLRMQQMRLSNQTDQHAAEQIAELQAAVDARNTQLAQLTSQFQTEYQRDIAVRDTHIQDMGNDFQERCASYEAAVTASEARIEAQTHEFQHKAGQYQAEIDRLGHLNQELHRQGTEILDQNKQLQYQLESRDAMTG